MIENLLLVFFAAAAVAGGALMIVLRHPMRVALALIASMISLGAIYGLLGVHVIAVFQIMIYVGAVMVFMVYAIMLLDVRDPSFTERWSVLLWPGLAAAVVLMGVLVAVMAQGPAAPAQGTAAAFGVQPFSIAFLERYWLYFELTSVLLVVAVLAAVAIVKLQAPAADAKTSAERSHRG
jgi:NADH-quinone oxidoreductase subunit J